MANILFPLNFTVDVDKGTREVTLSEPLVQGDNTAHRINLTLKRGVADADLSGATAYCYVINASKQTVVVQGAVSGNIVYATLNSACYAVPGRIRILMRLSCGSVIETPLYLTGSVISGTTDAIIDPDDIVPSLDELLALVATMEAEIAESRAATDAASTATINTIAAGERADSAAEGAIAAKENADKATANANAVAAKWDSVEVDVTMQPPNEPASGSVTQTEHETTIHLNLPQGSVTNATLYMADQEMELFMRMPLVPEIGTTYALDLEEPDQTELFRLEHGY